MARNLREGINQINQDLDEIGERWEGSKLGQGVDRAATRLVNLGSAAATPFITFVGRAGKSIIGRGRREKEKKQVPKKKAKGGVVTGSKKKRSGPRGVGCAKRGYGKALS
tara:strand:- start:1830 stop:2159 length:330 start_codon:yes stop_codon:yes gene_type:complete